MRCAHASRVLILDGFWNKALAGVRSLGRRGFFVGVGERNAARPRHVLALLPAPICAPLRRRGGRRDSWRRWSGSSRSAATMCFLPMELSTQLLVTAHRERLAPLVRIPFADADGDPPRP